MESSKITVRFFTDDNLFIMGMVLAILGFYAIAELELFTGLIIVFLGYGTIITTTKIGKQICRFLLFKIYNFVELLQKDK